MNKRKIIKYILIGIISTTYASIGKAQTKSVIEKMDTAYQKCLDEGDDMLNCSKQFYKQMDSLLNVVYKQIIVKYPNRKDEMKKEQLQWLKSRDRQFLAIEKMPREKGLSSYDNQMIIIDKKSEIVKQRVLVLIEKRGML